MRSKQAKENSAFKGFTAAGEILFEAGDGSIFKGSLKGAGLDPLSVTITGPEGPVAVTAVGKPGMARLGPLGLHAGTGRYRVSFSAMGGVSCTFSSKLPRAIGVVRE